MHALHSSLPALVRGTLQATWHGSSLWHLWQPCFVREQWNLALHFAPALGFGRGWLPASPHMPCTQPEYSSKCMLDLRYYMVFSVYIPIRERPQPRHDSLRAGHPEAHCTVCHIRRWVAATPTPRSCPQPAPHVPRQYCVGTRTAPQLCLL